MILGLLVASENANRHTHRHTRFMFYKYRYIWIIAYTQLGWQKYLRIVPKSTCGSSNLLGLNLSGAVIPLSVRRTLDILSHGGVLTGLH